MPKYFAMVPAAGSGARFGATKPKQYLDILGKPLLYHTLAILTACPDIARVWVVLSPDDVWWQRYSWTGLGPKLESLFCGGKTRAESVFNAMNAASSAVLPDDWVLVHDAARPCLSEELLQSLIAALQEDAVGGLLALPLADTLKKSDTDQRVEKTLPREGLWQAQTPQMFRYSTLFDALKNFPEVTDEASAIEAAGFSPRLITGSTQNLKVTYPADYALASVILRSRDEKCSFYTEAGKER